jgi:hypothetical protein
LSPGWKNVVQIDGNRFGVNEILRPISSPDKIQSAGKWLTDTVLLQNLALLRL